MSTKQNGMSTACGWIGLVALLALSGCGDSGDGSDISVPDAATGDSDTDADTDSDVDSDADSDSDADTDTDTDSDTDTGECTDNDDCTDDPANPICTDGVCGPCSDGILDCPCDDDSCSEGECVDGTCVDCDRGDVGCVCRANDTCEDGAVCGDDGICEPCTDGIEFCPCGAGDTCDTGLVCESGTCVEDTCSAGTEGCPCDEDSCDDDDLYCDNLDICRACTSEVAGCPCESDDTCLGDNYCDTSASACVECPSDDKPASCGCTDSGDCDSPLVCDADDEVCRDRIDCASAGCAENQLCDDTGPDGLCLDGQCEGGYEWNSSTSSCDPLEPQYCADSGGIPSAQAVACEAMEKGCALDEYEQVVCVDTCESLECLALDRDCVAATDPTDDAVCSDCMPGYEEIAGPLDAGLPDAGGADAGPVDPSGFVCVTDSSANCAQGDSDSILSECDDRFMLCVPGTGSDGASCQGCKSGGVFEPDLNMCVELPGCGSDVCEADEFCDYPQTGEIPGCVARCPTGQAYDGDGFCAVCATICPDGLTFGRQIDGECVCEDEVFCAQQFDGADRCVVSPCPEGEATDGTTCTACVLACGNDEGERTRIWPIRTRQNECICETQAGYYLPYGSSASPRLCDQDLDGWINETAESTYTVASTAVQGKTGEAMLANFRCEIREIDRIVQINEYGQKREVGVCSGELYNWEPDSLPVACEGVNLAVMILAEPDVIDDDNAMANDATSFYPYRTRALKAAEVNSLTRACVSTGSDYNSNGIVDLVEAQPLTKLEAGGASDAELLLLSNTHFIELHTTGYTPPTSVLLSGSLWVKERSRCAAEFPVTYSVGRGGYWEGCLRRRDNDWDEAEDRTGIDFGYTACAAADGTCPLPSPTTTDDNDDGDQTLDHDLCAYESFGNLPLDEEPWLGMNHSSQFRCAQVSSGGGAHQVPRSLLQGGTGVDAYDFNHCTANGTVSPSDGYPQPSDPVIECVYQDGAGGGDVADDAVGMVSVNYLPDYPVYPPAPPDPPPYTRGCIDEAGGTIGDTIDGPGWSLLCPGYTENPTGVFTTDNLGDFGKLMCSCGNEYSGTNCEFACPVRYGNSLLESRLHRGNNAYDGYTEAQKSEYGCDPLSGYCLAVPPDPYTGFTGGRQGLWMCGEFTASRGVDGKVFMTGSFEESSGTVAGELRGAVRTVPFVRTQMAADPGVCSGDANKCFTLF